jgi:hypothetical protein
VNHATRRKRAAGTPAYSASASNRPVATSSTGAMNDQTKVLRTATQNVSSDISVR